MALEEEARFLGVDVGGTKIAFGWVDLTDGNVAERHEIPTRPHRPGREVLHDVVSSALGMGSGPPGEPIGVAICELVDGAGRVTSAQTIDWTDLDPATALAPVGSLVLSSDVRAGALAEARLGAGRGLESFLYVAVGTGVSATFVVEGNPWAGANGNALIIATGRVSCLCPVCGAETSLVPEEIASGGGMTRRLAGRHPELGIERTEQVLEAAEGGDTDAIEVISAGGRMLGAVVGWAVNLLDPHAVVLGGGLGLAPGLYREEFLGSLSEHIWAASTRDLAVQDAALGIDAVLVGAALAAAEGRPA